MSGYIGDAITRKGIQAQEVGFLQKPFAPTVLARKSTGSTGRLSRKRVLTLRSAPRAILAQRLFNQMIQLVALERDFIRGAILRCRW